MSGEYLHRSSMMCSECGFDGNIVLLPLLPDRASFSNFQTVFVCSVCNVENRTSVDLQRLEDTEGKIVYEIRHFPPVKR